MKTNRNDDSDDKSQVPAAGAGADDSSDETERRLKRIREYRRTALAVEDPLRANLGAVNADLLEMATQTKEQWNKTVERATDSRAELVQRRVLVDDFLRLTRQSDRYSQLEIKLRRSANED
jgi:hypothetical protein